MIVIIIILILIVIILLVKSKTPPQIIQKEPEEQDPFAGVPEFHAHAQLEEFGKDPGWLTEYIQVDTTEDYEND